MRPYNRQIKYEAVKLRRKGLSYKEISIKIKIAKSTAKLWCSDVVLKPEQRKRLYTKQIGILSTGPNSSHERRKREIEEIVKKAKQEIRFPLNEETYKLFGAALYWAEGSKTKHFAVTNSDPLLIKFIVEWTRKFFGIKPKNIKAHLNIYQQQNEAEIKEFWSNLTGIPLKNFGKTFIKPSNKFFKKNTLYYGTIRVMVPKGTDLRIRIFGWISAVLKNIYKDVEQAERKWYKLKTDYKRR